MCHAPYGEGWAGAVDHGHGPGEGREQLCALLAALVYPKAGRMVTALWWSRPGLLLLFSCYISDFDLVSSLG